MAGICSKVFSLNTLKCIIESKDIRNTSLISSFGQVIQIRNKFPPNPRPRFPLWYLKKEKAKYDEKLTVDNAAFIKEVSHEKFGPPAIISGIPTYKVPSPLKKEVIENGEWTPGSRRCGLITRKIGCYPMWNKKGDIVWSTLLQVVDNHVIKYTPPEEYNPRVNPKAKPKKLLSPNKYGVLLVGAESCDPQIYTKEYCGLFAGAGLPPKKVLGRFMITPNAAIQPGTPLFATHFRPGDVVDVAGFTIDRGFQGVMKRWGFKGMPASHGVTKTHRRPGNIGGGGEKARVWPGKKMPGHMGNRRRFVRGLKIWRINTKYNVLYVQGLAVPGLTNSVIYVHDTLLPLRRLKDAPASFPTFFPENREDPLPEDIYDEALHEFGAPTINFDDQKE